ncbi:hypothetical protein T266_15560 [Pseudomonas aeruginosa VRFPA05]|jgi:hypothetical protein|nr:hypothetical protein T266_18375 [Pseudomonas aeruginosa VRFPA05]ESR70330.1 hypothetical protein T266_15560 [Pseudomonas aeruginosa VRFPA05]
MEGVMNEMSQDTFGIIMLTGLLLVCLGMAAWADWPRIKSYLKRPPSKH